MPQTVPLRCACGQVRGVLEVTKGTGQRLVCYCDDCQAYARFLGRDDVLDARGGTDIFQTRPALVRITEGESQLACVRLSDKGLMRWYARCCRTPIGNTIPLPSMPFVGLVHRFMDHEAGGRSRDAALGPPVARVHGRYAKGGVPEGVHPTVTIGIIARAVWMLARGWLARGNAPSPFFDTRTKLPRVKPEVLSRVGT